MNQKFLSRMLLGIFTLQSASFAQQPPSTQPALDYYNGQRAFTFSSLGDSWTRLKITLNPDVNDGPTLFDLEPLINGLTWTVQGPKPYSVFLSVNLPDKARLRVSEDHTVSADVSLAIDQPASLIFEDLYKLAQSRVGAQGEVIRRGAGGARAGGGGGRRGFAYDPSMPAFFELLQPKTSELTKEAVQRLKTLVASEPRLSPAQRNQRLDELSNGIASLVRKMDVLTQLSKAQPDAAARVMEKLRHFREREQDLQMKLSAQQARRIALEKGLAELRNQAQERTSDARIQYYRAGIDLKQKIYDRKSKAPAGTFNLSEIQEAEADLIQAKAALAVAEAEATKGGRSELMDQLANELTMVSIDTTDLQIQLSQLHDMMSKYDPAVLDTKNLNALLEGEPGFGGADTPKLPPLYYELQKQRNDLRREQLVLIIDDVSIASEAPPAP